MDETKNMKKQEKEKMLDLNLKNMLFKDFDEIRKSKRYAIQQIHFKFQKDTQKRKNKF